MKWFIASDIHGSAYYCREMLGRFDAEHADRILLLGDILYHGPRNDLPRDYSPKEVIAMLSKYADSIFCVRGNCEAEVDQMVLPFPVLADYALIEYGGRMIFATHGHLFNAQKMPPLKDGDILIHGHTHIPQSAKQEGVYVLNPGSVSIPKSDSRHSYMILQDGVFKWHDISDGTEYMTLTV